MEVIYLISRAKIAGPINQALNILSGLNRMKGVHARLVTFNKELPNNSWLHRFKENGIEVVQLNKKKYDILGTCLSLKKYVKENRIEVVHSAGYRADLINMLTFGKSITVSTQRCHPIETTLHTIPLLRKFALKLRLFNLRHLSEIVACSESLQEIFALELNMNISVVQNGVNTDFFKPTTINNKISLRNELKLPVQKKIYLVLGNICKRKNIGLIIKSFNNIRNCNAILLIVGNGDETEQMKALSADNQSIIFVGKTDTPLKFLQASDYLVSAALAEGLPNTVLEALSCGLPCILSDINPHKELIQDSNVGLLFNVHSQTQLEKAIETSFNWDMSLMSENARSLAENKFSIDVLAHNYYKIYKSLCTQS